MPFIKKPARFNVIAIAAIVLVIAVAFVLRNAPYVGFEASPTFPHNGEYSSTNGTLVDGIPYGSWRGADQNTGSLTSDVFRAPQALTLAIIGYPANAGEGLELEDGSDASKSIRLQPGPNVGETWTLRLIDIPQQWRGHDVRLVATDAGKEFTGWFGIADVRPARWDELLIGSPISSGWNYAGVLYLALAIASIWTIVRATPRVRDLRLYLVLVTAIAGLAFRTGWNNIDLSGWFASWGRNALAVGPAGLYDSTWASDNPPLNPSIMVVPAILESALHAAGTLADPFFYKLIPIASLFALPFIIRAVLIATGSAATRFNLIVCCTLLNPALIYSTAIWGQSDVYLMGLMLASFAAAITARPDLGAGLFVASILTKPQAILTSPIVAVALLRTKAWLKLSAGTIAVLILILPATYPHGGLIGGYIWLFGKFRTASAEYAYASIGAGTFPELLAGDGYIPDTVVRFGLSIQHIGFAASAIGALAVFAFAIRERGSLATSRGVWYLTVSAMTIYWFAPHMHERYLTYAAIASIVWALSARVNILAALGAAALNAALIVQMVVNWPLDLGWKLNVADTFMQFAPHDVYYTIYAVLNVLGYALVLLSRVYGVRDATQPLKIAPTGIITA